MSLAFSARLARREVRRRPGRTALVTLLITVPYVAIGLGAIMGRTSDLTNAERMTLSFGTSDISIPVTGLTQSKAFKPDVWLNEMFGPEAKWTLVTSAFAPMSKKFIGQPTGDEARNVQVITDNLASPMTADTFQKVIGRGPIKSDEVVVSAPLAKVWGLTKGSHLELSVPQASLRIVGIFNKASDLRGNYMWVTKKNDIVRSYPNFSAWINLDSPDVTNGRFPLNLRQRIEVAANGGDGSQPMSDLEKQFWLGANASLMSYSMTNPVLDSFGLFAVLAFVVLAIVISAAFATSARRQMTTIGQLSANGASTHEVTRSLALQGAWSGLVAIVLGAGPIIWFATNGQGIAQRFVSHVITRMDVPVSMLIWITLVALVSSTVAAWIPSRSAAKVSVLDALAGRRKQKATSRSYALWGFVLFVAGVGLEFLAAIGSRNMNNSTSPGSSAFFYAGIIGGLAILASICLVGQVLVRVFDVLGSRFSGTLRMASRGLARNRSRSAAVVVSIAAFGALGASVSAGYLFSYQPEHIWFPRNQVVELQRACPNYFETNLVCVLDDVKPEVAKSVDAIVGTKLSQTMLKWASFLPAKPFAAPISEHVGYLTQPAYVASPSLLDVVKMHDKDREALQKFGIIRLATRQDSSPSGILPTLNEPFSAVLVRDTGREEYPSAYLSHRISWPDESQYMVTEEFAQEHHMNVKKAGRVITLPKNLTDAQSAKLGILVTQQSIGSMFTADLFDDQGAAIQASDYEVPRAADRSPESVIQFNQMQPLMDPRTMQTIVAISIFLVVAFVVSIGLALMAAEGKDERDVLVSVGAPPSVQTRIAGVRAAGLSLLGLVLAFPVGVIPTVLTARTARMTKNLGSVWSEVPWSLGGLYLVLPAVMFIAAMVASACAQAVRPVHISNSAFD